MGLPRSLRKSIGKLAPGLCAGLIGVAALVSGTGVAQADPEDAIVPIIEDLFVNIPGLTQDFRSTDTPNNFGVPGAKDWTGSGNFCQNRNAKCQKMGF
jgi:hypothetical protein